MRNFTRHLILGLMFAMGLNHLVLGLFWMNTFVHPGPVLLAFCLYLIALTLTIYGHRNIRIPATQAYLNLLLSAVIPVLVLVELPVARYPQAGSYQTWFVAGVSLILALTSGRGYPIVGWIGLAMLWVEVIVWGGPRMITITGLIGATILVAAAWGMCRGLRSTEEASRHYHEQAAEVATRLAQNEASRTERQKLLQATLLSGLPLLQRIDQQGGELSDQDRAEAILLEGRFRDEIQGRNLLNDGVRVATREARRRGVDVTFNDEGGLDALPSAEAEAVRVSIMQAIAATTAGKIHVGAPRGETYAVSIVASRPDASGPDLWLRLP